MMFFDAYIYTQTHTHYIAGTGSGIVTVNTNAASRDIVVFDAQTLSVVCKTASVKNGHYLIPSLDADKTYLVIARDYKREYEPVAYDYVKPVSDLTANERNELWRSWQT